MGNLKLLITKIGIVAFALLSINSAHAFNFMNTSTIHLRDSQLQNPINIMPGSTITIDPTFLRQHLGTETPTPDQIQEFLLNPSNSAAGGLQTERFYVAGSNRPRNDYFVPIRIQSVDGKEYSGKTAFQYYMRNDQLIIDGAQINERRRILTEANTVCTNCTTVALNQVDSLRQVTAQIDRNGTASTHPLYERYLRFARNFSSQFPKNRLGRYVPRNQASAKRAEFVRSLIREFGIEDASKIIAVLTGYGEAPSRNNSSSIQIAEIAAILKVIENRAHKSHFMNSTLLRNIGVDKNANRRLSVTLADQQFSVWNLNDNNLSRILSFSPDEVDPATKKKMALSFEAQQMIAGNRVQFVGNMNAENMLHYHATTTTPKWAVRSKVVGAPIVRVDGVDINLSQQRGTKHIFYAGVP